MLQEDKYFQTLSEEELWQRYCGFLDLSIDEFIEIQEHLLMDEIELVADSLLGKKIMGNQKPKSVDEFRRTIPLTNYDDYEPYLSERREDALAARPYFWCHSAGRGGAYKWIPHSTEVVDKAVRTNIGSFILASSSKKGEVNIAPGFRLFAALPPPPYTSGAAVEALAHRLSFQAIIPSPEQARDMDFQQRVQKGFQIALKDGVDVLGALGSVLVKIGEGFNERRRTMKFSLSMLHPKIVFRLLRAMIRSKMMKRPILPKDLWAPKGIVTGGVDTAIYKKEIAYYWGREPFEFYVSAEVIMVAMQAWNKRGMTFLPDIVFLEFIPYDEQLKHKDDKDYQPSTVLLNEVEEGKLYEVVITQFYGMPLLRYRMRDLIKVIALRDGEAGINLPQIAFQRKVNDVIELAGLARLDEKTIWQAIANTGIKYNDWSARKEYDQSYSFLRLYLELKEEKEAAEVANMIDEQLKMVDTDYKDIDAYLELQPVRITLLSPGTFQSYMEEKRKEGADLAHLKPTHINAPEAVIQRLLQLSEVTKE